MLLLTGIETYENQKKFAKIVFDELQEIQRNGLIIEGVMHDIELVCCCDWKASAIIEGKINEGYQCGFLLVYLRHIILSFS